jgi:hypothetical protein
MSFSAWSRMRGANAQESFSRPRAGAKRYHWSAWPARTRLPGFLTAACAAIRGSACPDEGGGDVAAAKRLPTTSLARVLIREAATAVHHHEDLAERPDHT